MNAWLSQTIVQALGWTLVHFLWQGLVIAALLAATLRIFRSSLAHYKYLAACAAMALMALAPLVTFRLVLSQTEPLPAIIPISAQISTVKTSEIFTLAQPTQAAIPNPPAVGFFERLNHLLPWLVLSWFAGVFVLSSRLFLGWLQVRRLRRTATRPLPSPWPERLAVLAQRLAISRPIQLLQSALIEVPTVIGWLRPVILLPASCLTGLTPGQLEAIIAHELAHIRRHDYLVNLLQSAIETLLFYHPAVWWVSRRIRDERENCCDDLAVEVSGDLVGYARALATLEELRPASAQLMLAAAGAPLLQRIRRLAGQPERSAGRASWPVAGIAVFLVLAIFAAGRMEHRATAAPRSADEITANEPPPLEVRTFHVDTKTFLHGLEIATGIHLISAGYGGSGGPGIELTAHDESTPAIVATGSQDTPGIPAALRIFFTADGVLLGTNPGKVIIFNEFKGTLTVRATSRDLKTIETAVQILNTPLPSAGDNGPAFTDQTQLARLILDGKYLYETGKYDEAEIKFKQALSIDPSNIPASQYLRLVAEKLQSPRKPIKLVADSAGTTSSPAATNEILSAANDSGRPPVKFIAQLNSASSEKISAPAKLAATSPEVVIEVKFVEIPQDPNQPSSPNSYLGTMPIPQSAPDSSNTTGNSAFPGTGVSPAAGSANANQAPTNNSRSPTTAPATTATFTGLLTDSQFHATIQALEQRDGTDVLTAHSVVTESGRQAQIQSVDIQQIVTSSGLGFGTNRPFATNGTVAGNANTPAFSPGITTLSTGPTICVIPTVSADGKSIDLCLIPSIVEFVGYDQPGNAVRGDFVSAGGVSAPAVPTSPPVDNVSGPRASASVGGVTSVLPLPHYRLRQVTVNVTAWDGQTVVIGGLATGGSTNTMVESVPLLGKMPYLGPLFRSESTQKIAKKQLLVFVTVTLINPDGTVYHSDEERNALCAGPPPQEGSTNR